MRYFTRTPRIVGAALSLAILAASGLGAPPTLAQTKQYQFVVKDSRDIGANSVRFAGAQGTQDMPNIVLLGASKEVWPKIRDAVRQAEDQGYRVRAVLVGPASAPPSLEIYAKGIYVSVPINPYTISQGDLVKLIRDVHHEYYGR